MIACAGLSKCGRNVSTISGSRAVIQRISVPAAKSLDHGSVVAVYGHGSPHPTAVGAPLHVDPTLGPSLHRCPGLSRQRSARSCAELIARVRAREAPWSSPMWSRAIFSPSERDTRSEIASRSPFATLDRYPCPHDSASRSGRESQIAQRKVERADREQGAGPRRTLAVGRWAPGSTRSCSP